MICREVTYWPSRPANGEVLTPKIIDTVGSSIAIGGMAVGILGVGDRLADRDVLDAGQADDVAGRGLTSIIDALQALEREQLGDLGASAMEPSSLQTRDRVADLDACR